MTSPLHRSGRAVFPHPAPTSGDDAKSLERVRVMDAHCRQPPLDVDVHSLPGEVPALAASLKRSLPDPHYLVPECTHRAAVGRHPVVSEMPTNDAAQPRTLLTDRVVHATPQLDLDLAELRSQSLRDRLPTDGEHSVAPLL